MLLVGNVRGKTAILVDDMADTCGTIVRATEELKQAGAKDVYAICVHGIFSGDAISKVEQSQVKELVVTNTLRQSDEVRKCKKINYIDVSVIIAEAIRRVHCGESISGLFNEMPPD